MVTLYRTSVRPRLRAEVHRPFDNNFGQTVPLSVDLEVALRRLKEDRKLGQSETLFIQDNGRPWKYWREAFKNALERAQVEDYRFHDLRPSYGAWLAVNDVNDEARMELMGHKNPKMTERYRRLPTDYKRQSVSKLPSFDSVVLEAKSPQISPSTKKKKVVGFRK